MPTKNVKIILLTKVMYITQRPCYLMTLMINFFSLLKGDPDHLIVFIK